MLIHRERTLSIFTLSGWARHCFIHSLSIDGSLDETAWRAPPNHPLDASPPPCPSFAGPLILERYDSVPLSCRCVCFDPEAVMCKVGNQVPEIGPLLVGARLRPSCFYRFRLL